MSGIRDVPPRNLSKSLRSLRHHGACKRGKANQAWDILSLLAFRVCLLTKARSRLPASPWTRGDSVGVHTGDVPMQVTALVGDKVNERKEEKTLSRQPNLSPTKDWAAVIWVVTRSFKGRRNWD